MGKSMKSVQTRAASTRRSNDDLKVDGDDLIQIRVQLDFLGGQGTE
jgi:hypothetical protein